MSSNIRFHHKTLIVSFFLLDAPKLVHGELATTHPPDNSCARLRLHGADSSCLRLPCSFL